MKKKTKRREADFYPTPDYTTQSLIDWGLNGDYFDMSRILEPCSGDGAISKMFCNPHRHIHQVELRPEENKNLENYGTVQIGDFLNIDINFKPTIIITNPPFNLAQEFIDKCLTYNCPVVMLLRLCFLSSGKRHDWWQNKIPSDLLVLSKRPSFTGNGKTDGQDYAWFIWNGLGNGVKII